VVGFYHSDVPATYIAPRLQRAPRAVRVAALGAAWGWVRAQHRRYDATLAASRHTADALLAHGVPRVRWVGLGVELGAAPPRAAHVEPPRAVGYVGRLAADKELPLALAAAPAIRRATGARLVVAGDGPLLPRVARAAARGDVDHHGVVPARQIPALLGELRALVVPGRYESFGLAAAEALAAGVPVIAPDAGGAGELVAAAGCGVHFRAGDAQALADAVARVSRWPRAEWHAHAARGRRYAEDRLGWPAVMARIHAVYREVVSGGERARAAPEASA
jgi:glycosyltransferase involved in cell wall biosynthesis